MSGRMASIDAMKGMAIVLVVVGHCLGWGVVRYVYWFHMPFFFLLSGYLFNGKYTVGQWWVRRSRHLLVPYLTFFILYVSACKLASHVGLLIPGAGDVPEKIRYTVALGFDLGSLWDYVTRGHRWWFITTLFFVQILGYGILKSLRRPVFWWGVLGALYGVALIDYCFLDGVRFPLYLDTVPMATVFYLLGARLRADEESQGGDATPAWGLVVLAVAVGGLFVLDRVGLIYHEFRLKQTVLGIPYVNVIIPFAVFLLVKRLAGAVSRMRHVSALLVEIGRAAMIVFFCHQDIMLVLAKLNARFTGVATYHYGPGTAAAMILVSLGVPYAAYRCLRLTRVTRVLFLGE